MALVVKDRVKETTTTMGTGTITLAGAVVGFQTFSAIGNGNVTYYCIAEKTGTEWEVGYGTYTASGTTLSRTVVLESSNAGSLVDFGAGTKEVFCTYPAERSVYLDAAGSAVTTLDIGTLGTSTANITTANITAGTITTPPTNNTDIVNKQYADAIASGIHFHEAVGYATTAALPASTYNNGTGGVNATLTGNVNGALTVDGYTFTSPADNGTRILIKNQTNGAENGVYTLSQAGNSSPGAPFILTRATDFDSVGTGVDQIDEGDFFLVTSGTANVNTAWVQQTPPPIIIGTTAIVFQQFSAPITYTAGTGLSESPTYTFNIANTGTAGTYGSASQVPVFVTNAQGQVTSVTNTSIAISGAAVSGDISGNAGSATILQTARNINGVSFNGSANINVNTNNAATFNDSGTGGVSGSTFNGGTALTVSYNTVGAPSTTGTNASGNWNINVTGSAASATTAGNVSGVVAVANGGTGASVAATAITNLGATTLGGNLFTILSPGAVTFPRFNADNTVSSLSATDFRTAIGAGTSSTTGTVTSVGGTGTASGLTLSGTVTTSGNLTLSGTVNSVATGSSYQMGSLGVGTAASGTTGEIRATNNVTAYFSSDIKFKENVRDIPDASATAKAIGGKLFDWTDAYIADHGGPDDYFVQKQDFGVIAQDVQKVFPIAVRTRPDGSLAVDYEKLSALALAAVAEQEDRIAKLEALVAKLIEG